MLGTLEREQLAKYSRGIPERVLLLWTRLEGRRHNKFMREGWIQWNDNEWILTEGGKCVKNWWRGK